MADFKRSTHATHWLYSPEEWAALDRRRHAALRRMHASDPPVRQVHCFAVEADPKPEADGSFALPEAPMSPADERAVQRHFTRMIVDVYAQAAERDSSIYSATAQATAIALFRRFYLSNSVVAYSPWLMMLAAILLASKVEERRVEPARLLKLFKYEDLTVEQLVLYESFLMEGCHFHFRVFHPYRPAAAFFDDFVHALHAEAAAGGDGRVSPEALPEAERAVREETHHAVTRLLLHDLAFQTAPATLALGALKYATKHPAPESGGNLPPELAPAFERYIAGLSERLPAAAAEKFAAEVNAAAAAVGEVLAEDEAAQSEEGAASMKKLRKQLKRCCLWKDDVPASGSKKKKKKQKLESSQAEEDG